MKCSLGIFFLLRVKGLVGIMMHGMVFVEVWTCHVCKVMPNAQEAGQPAFFFPFLC